MCACCCTGNKRKRLRVCEKKQSGNFQVHHEERKIPQGMLKKKKN